ncbi:YaaC family protein [Tepidibacillus fermentans]|uniref:YaaC-like protein n=1 Tax=Tepidibacillus fermentans TaxID=1281767 RepID=A0A4R3K5W3_9BACI|nr:YaaC family protein [Tepidibacillus fermentans]TCS78130.1 YaaC-like protein [Tepidibacillus fermentans]
MKTIHFIYSENPYQKMWDTFVYFESEAKTKQYLQEIYEKIDEKNGYKLAFHNTSKFIYFIKQAREYFHSAEKSNILVKPLLIYYGMMNLMKAVILTKDPSYPSHTGVLRHGITTRKLKKSNYQFHEDEIKIQKEGLIPLFYNLITQQPIEKIDGQKFKIKELLSLLPEILDSYKKSYDEQRIYPIFFENEKSHKFYLPIEILSHYHGNKNEVLSELNLYYSKKEESFQFVESNNPKFLNLQLVSNNNEENFHIIDHPMFLIDFKGRSFLKPILESRFLLPNLMIYYMIMFNLGMLCRYETELWGEIIFSFSSEDMYIINEFINSSLRTFPNLILNELFQGIHIFK